MSKEQQAYRNPQDEEEFDYFAVDNTSDYETPEETGGNSDSYTPSLKDEGAKAPRESVIRFLPNPFATKSDRRQVIAKWGYSISQDLADVTGLPRWLDCNSNAPGRPPLSIISKAYIMLKDDRDESLKSLAKANFVRRRYYWALVLVVEDNFRPDDVGKIKFLRYTETIQKLIDQQRKGHRGDAPCIVQNPFFGKDFQMVITENNIGNGIIIPEYKESYFHNSATPMHIDFSGASPVKLPKLNSVTDLTPELRKQVDDFLKSNSPNLVERHGFKGWDDQTEGAAIRYVKEVLDDDTLFNRILKATYRGRTVPEWRDSIESNTASSAHHEVKEDLSAFKQNIAPRGYAEAPVPPVQHTNIPDSFREQGMGVDTSDLND